MPRRSRCWEGCTDQQGARRSLTRPTGRRAVTPMTRMAARMGARNPAASSSVTLEPSFESLRLKKLDTSFAVDPLFHKTSAQFDEGGAKGLLLSTLSCYRGCHLIFDSDDVPDASVDETSSTAKGPTSHTMLDLSQLARPLENACSLMGLCHGITPALDGIRAMLGYDDEDKDAEVASLFYEYEDDDEGGATASSKRRLQAGAWGMTAEGGVATLRGEDRGADARGAACREEPEASYGGHGNYGDDDDGGMDYGGGDHDDDGDYGEDAGVAASSSVYVDAVSDAGTAFFSGDSGGTHAGGDEVMSRDHQGPPTGSPGPAHSSDASLGGSLGFGSYTSEQLSGWAAAAGAEPALGLSLLLGSAGQKAAAWAGPDHWRFRPRAATPADDAAEGEEDASSGATKAKKGGKKAPFFIDFEALPEVPAGTFTLATKRGEIEASAATLPLRGAGASGACATLLPDDLQYAPRELMCLFLKPSWQGLLSVGSHASEDAQDGCAREMGDGDHGVFDDEDYAGDGGDGDADEEGDAWGGGGVGDDLGDLLANLGAEAAMAGVLVDAPNKVAQISVNYARAAKQVDVRALKQVLWESLQRAASMQPQEGTAAEQGLSFQQLLRGFQQPCPAGMLQDISVHLCFICVLHLANEHGLAIVDRPDLTELYVRNVGAALHAAMSPAH
eukprot:jgi/Mesvir1/9730/Mv12196-RA.1